MPLDAVYIPFRHAARKELDPNAISPELVLVDPELARTARAELCAAAEQLARPPLRPTKPEPLRPSFLRPEAEPASRGTHALVAWVAGAFGAFFTTIFAVSILLNLALVGALFSLGSRPTLASPAPVTSPPGQVLQTPTTVTPTVTPGTKARIERDVLALLVRTPRSRLPSALVDRHTGLLKNGVQVVCRRHPSVRARFLCVASPPRAAPGTGLYIKYRVTAEGRPKTTLVGFHKG